MKQSSHSDNRVVTSEGFFELHRDSCCIAKAEDVLVAVVVVLVGKGEGMGMEHTRLKRKMPITAARLSSHIGFICC
jgi:hypothetical protein